MILQFVEKTVRKGVEPQSRTRIIFHGDFEYAPEDRQAIRALGQVLSIRLREKLREELGGTYGVSARPSFTTRPDTTYTFSFSFGAEPERLEELARVVFEQLEAVKQDGPTEEEVQKVLETQRRGHETSLRENGYWLGVNQDVRRSGLTVNERLEEDLWDDVTAEMIRTVAAKYLDFERFVRVSLYPENIVP